MEFSKFLRILKTLIQLSPTQSQKTYELIKYMENKSVATVLNKFYISVSLQTLRILLLNLSARYSTVKHKPSLYDARKFAPHLPDPGKTFRMPFAGIPNMPRGIFRPIIGEKNIKASKDGSYQNVEYFSYHNMSFYDVHYLLADERIDRPTLPRKPGTFMN